MYVIIVSRISIISIISTTSLQSKVSCCVFMLSIIGPIWPCRFAMNGRKIYKRLKTRVKTHPVALLLNLFFFFIVSKPPSLSCRRGCLRSLADLCSQQKTQMLLTKHLKDLKNWFESVRTLEMELEFGSVGLLRRGEEEKNLSE